MSLIFKLQNFFGIFHWGNRWKKKYTAYHLFNSKEASPPRSHDCCVNQKREIGLNIFNFTLEPEEKREESKKL